MSVNQHIFLQVLVVSIDIYQGSPFVSVYYVMAYYMLLETLARYTTGAC